MRIVLLIAAPVLLIAGCAREMETARITPAAEKRSVMDGEKVVKSDEEWKKELTPEQYHILREKGTERAFTGKYWNYKEDGTYTCAACGQELFKSDAKFDSGCGWPSFFDALDKARVNQHDDYTHGMHRIEVTCARCGGHLGHVFPDGPKPTGLRYCINSASINFKKKDE